MEVKNIVLLVIFVLGIVILQFVTANTVDDIINKYIEALGGKDKLNAIRSVYMEGTRKVMGIEMPVTITKVQGKLFRTDYKLEGTKGYIIITPIEGWSLIPTQSPFVQSTSSDRLTKMQPLLDIAGPLVNYAAKGNKAEWLGKETINENEAYKIKLTIRTGDETYYYIDTETNLVIQTRQIGIENGNNTQEVITDYSDYKLFDGIMFPQTISNPAEGIMAGTTTFKSIIINKPVDDSFYNPYA